MSPAEPQPKVGIIAGGGDLPIRLAEACAASGRAFHIVGLEGSAEGKIEAFPHGWSAIGAVGRIEKLLRDAGCKDVVLAGKVLRPDFTNLKLDFKGAMLLPKVIAAAQRGDGHMLSLLIETLEKDGFRVIGADDVFTGLVMRPRLLTRAGPVARDERDIARAIEVIKATGRFDIGQGAVVCDGLVLAVEAAEGTDLMLERCANLPEQLRGTPGKKRGVLVKIPKPLQEQRVDLPVIGRRTIELAAAAGLAGIAVRAGRALIIDEAEVVQSADERGLFLLGIGDKDEPPA